MLLHEWNMQEALEVRFEEGVAIGKEEGITIGETRGVTIGKEEERSHIRELLKQGLSHEEILERLDNR